MKKLLFFLPLLVLADTNPFNIDLSSKNFNLLTPQEKAIVKNKEEIKKLKEKVDQLSVKLVKYDEVINNLNEKLQGLDTLVDEVSNLQQEVDKLKKENNDTKAKLERIQEALNEMLKTQQIQARNIETLKDSINVIISQLKEHEITPKSAMKKAKDYFYKGNLDKAKEYFLYTLSKKYLPATSAFYLGEIYYKKGKYDLALGYYKKSVEFYPKKTSFTDKLLYHTGISFEKTGNKEAAKLTFEKLINDFPNSKYAKLAKKELEKLK